MFMVQSLFMSTPAAGLQWRDKSVSRTSFQAIEGQDQGGIRHRYATD
jgi:hypothetical protein